MPSRRVSSSFSRASSQGGLPTHAFRVTLSYDGTRYRGWQIQPDQTTVQGALHDAAIHVLGTPRIEIGAAGRTDAGVHALGQVAHLKAVLSQETLARFKGEGLRYAFNDHLPHDVHVHRIEPVPLSFHARHDAVSRSYLYQLSHERTAFAKKWVWWVKDALSLDAMREAARYFEGRVDFRHFTERDPEEGSTLVHMSPIRFASYGHMTVIQFHASHFLWKQIRRMVGVLVQVGRGHIEAHDVAELLSRPYADVAEWTAPPSGLYFERAYYGSETLPEEIRLPFDYMMGESQ